MNIFVIKDSLGTPHKACKTLNDALEHKFTVQKQLNESNMYIGKITCTVVEIEIYQK